MVGKCSLQHENVRKLLLEHWNIDFISEIEWKIIIAQFLPFVEIQILINLN